ncbi:hypothetical protein, partial [Mycoplana azooxidifex]|uniref:hypothetical protein n=1 Tax=Mycoplana azooxidifex TaxID=1636188 RepID=UPI001AEDFA00
PAQRFRISIPARVHQLAISNLSMSGLLGATPVAHLFVISAHAGTDDDCHLRISTTHLWQTQARRAVLHSGATIATQ